MDAVKGGGPVLQIGEVASRVGLSLRTIRHWDEVGLVVPSARSTGGFRLYTEDDVQRLLLVKSLKPLDLSLDQIRDLVQLIDACRGPVGVGTGHDDDAAGAHDGEQDAVRDRLAAYLAAAEGRIDALRAQLHGLQSLARELRVLARPAATSSSTPASIGERES